MTKKARCLVIALCTALTASAQDYNGLWHTAPVTFGETHGGPALRPVAYKTFTADEASLKGYLNSLSSEYAQARIITLPTPDGNYRDFRIWSTPMMEAPLAAEYPEITTYTAEAVSNKQVTAKIDYTPFGFHAMVFDGQKTYLIDPYSGKAEGAYIAYYKQDYTRPAGQTMACEAGEQGLLQPSPDPVGQLTNGTVRKQYRLALAADSEYCIAVAGANPTKAAVLAKMTTSINRVNGVYERELAVALMLVAKEDTLIFNTTAQDPYTNNNGSTMLGQNQSTITARIGSANYDIGHVFSTGGGGIAYQGCICQSGSKARGVTGNPSPVGDAFDIDYVSHEMGHQFGASHTFNANTGSCLNNGVSTEAFEPGSGSTIMAYAGICTGNDYQQHSDAYFHSASLEEITAYITSGGGQTCASTTTSTNTNATLPSFSASYNIPYKTPFELTGPIAIDATADTITYCWEERDLGDFKATLAATHFAGPLFRSFTPSMTDTRVFPSLSRLLNGLSTPGEKLPDTARTMKFQMTERDVYQGWGTFNFSSDAITLNVTNTGRPFTVISPSGGDIWVGGTTKTVTWDVANTTNAPISCNTVDILLSIDGGYTWPYTLKSATANDGSETITVPSLNGTFTSARVKVKGTGNVFFNIDYGNFEIDPNPAGVSNNLLESGVRVAPVPATSVLQVTVAATLGSISGRLVNTLGQEVWTGSLKASSSISVASLPRGVYYLQLSAEGEAFTRTVVLQ